MQRNCTRCQRPFTPRDLARDESRNMEADRKTAGLVGVRFVYYTCPACAMADIFVDILPLAEEPPEAFQRRRDEMEVVVRRLHAERGTDEVAAVVIAVNPVALL